MFKFWTHCVLSHPFDFVLALTELFLPDVTAEVLPVSIDSKLAISSHGGPVDPKFHVEGVAPHQPFFAEN